MNPTLQSLQKKVEELEKRLNDMNRMATFPRDVRSAITDLISDKDETITIMTRTGGAAASVTRVATDSRGDTVTVPAYPDGYRVFQVGGRDIYIPYFNRA